LRAGLEEVQKGNALIVKLVANASSLEVPPESTSRTSNRKSIATYGLTSPAAGLTRVNSSSSLGAGDTDDDYQVN